MRRPTMKVQLKPSKIMSTRAPDDPEEHGRIRMPKAARQNFAPTGKKIQVSAGTKEFLLQVHQAIVADIRSLRGSGVLLATVGFVTQKTYNAVMGKGTQEEAWVSETSSNLILGSDPEWGLVSSPTKMLYAKTAYPGELVDDLGHDGPCMEIRPAPSSSVDGHIKTISELLARAGKIPALTSTDWFSGALFKCEDHEREFVFGGHIHVGNPASLTEVVEREGEGLEGDVHRRMVRIMDDLVGLPLTRVDGPQAGRRRAGKSSNNYGFFGEFRKQTARFEWRTPSAIWLTDPLLAKAVLGTVKAVSEHAYSILEDNNYDGKFVRSPQGTKYSLLAAMACKTDADVKEKLHASDFDVVSGPEMKVLHKRLASMSTYKKYKIDIDLFIKITGMTATKARKTNFFGMRDAWLADKTALAM